MTIIWNNDDRATERAALESEYLERKAPRAGVDYRIGADCPLCGAHYPKSLRAMINAPIECETCGAQFVERHKWNYGDLKITFERLGE